jgi:hypothetical protein
MKKWWWCKTHDTIHLSTLRDRGSMCDERVILGSCRWVIAEPPKEEEPPLNIKSLGDVGLSLHTWGNEGLYR